jgi:predicted nucleic acid-binding protein
VILVDTSVWIDHLRRGQATLRRQLEEGRVVCHPFVVGELSLGLLRQRAEILARLQRLPQLPIARHEEVRALVERRRLMGSGIGWVDAHLLASVLIARARLWTLDARLAAVGHRLGVV